MTRLYVRYPIINPEDPPLAVVAWNIDDGEAKQLWDEAGNPAGLETVRPASTTLAGYADIIIAAQLIETAFREDGMVWLSDTDPPALESLTCVWAKDILYTATEPTWAYANAAKVDE